MAQAINGHWTNDSTRAFLYRIAFDFVTQLEHLMDADGVTPTELAKRLGITKGRVSQIMNNPGNLTLKTIVEWARALDVKVAVVAYNDGDPDNENGPVNPQIFATCWERAGQPTDFFSAGMIAVTTTGVEIGRYGHPMRDDNAEPDDEIADTLSTMPPDVWKTQDAHDELESYAGTESDQL